MNQPFQFSRLPTPIPWRGRYNRIPGKEPVFRTSAAGSASAYWKPWNTDEALTSPFVPSDAVGDLITAVNHTKETHAGSPGGAFQINEFGQVLCPIPQSSARYWIGTITGVPQFIDPRRPKTRFELRLPSSTQPGTPWDRPYIGMKFNLDSNDSIYFLEDDGDIRFKKRLTTPNPDLVSRLRAVRGPGQSIRFIVNLHGVVLTKSEPAWEPVFVGVIDTNRWFPKEP